LQLAVEYFQLAQDSLDARIQFSVGECPLG